MLGYSLGKASLIETMTRYGVYDLKYGFGVLENWSHDAYGGGDVSARPGAAEWEEIWPFNWVLIVCLSIG